MTEIIGSALPAPMPASMGPVLSATPQNLQTLLSDAQPGQRIKLTPGVYGNSSSRWYISKSGNSGAPITVAAAPKTVTVQGRMKSEGSYVRFEGLKFAGPSDKEVPVWLAGGTAVEMRDCEITGSDWHAGVFVSDVTDLRIERCFIHHNGRFSISAAPEGGYTYNLDHGIYVSSCKGGVILNSLIDRSRGFGIQLYGGEVSNLIVSGCTIVRSGNCGIVVDSSGISNLRITGCVIAQSNQSSGSGSVKWTNCGSGCLATHCLFDKVMAGSVPGASGGNQVGDPCFGWNLRADSPGIGLAEPAYSFSPDLAKATRGIPVEAGCYENH